MFYVRITKIRIFNNCEGVFRLFNLAGMRIHSYVTALSEENNLRAGRQPLTVSNITRTAHATVRMSSQID
jgi:hypothetical protein